LLIAFPVIDRREFAAYMLEIPGLSGEKTGPKKPKKIEIPCY
jgi:hypothetical protein